MQQAGNHSQPLHFCAEVKAHSTTQRKTTRFRQILALTIQALALALAVWHVGVPGVPGCRSTPHSTVSNPSLLQIGEPLLIVLG